MFDLDKLVRPNIKKLAPYSSARDEYTGLDGIFLDANENPFGNLNRYPDPYQKELKAKIAEIKKIDVGHIFLGNGSDEIIDLLFRIFCEPGQDKAVVFSPTYGMYSVSAGVNDIAIINVPLTNTFQLDIPAFEATIKDKNIKLAFLCSPNNPTANSFDASDIEKVLATFNGIVVVDEAYIDFSAGVSWLSRLQDYPNLVVMQTMSKAWGLAAARLGIGYASSDIIGLLNKVKPPYNISVPNQVAVLEVLNNPEGAIENIKKIVDERSVLTMELKKISLVKHIYPSDANFLLVEVENANDIYEKLVAMKVIIRNRHSLVKNCLRITVGSPKENKILVEALKALSI